MMPNPNDQPTAEVISIGDEMTSGARLDTNSQWLSRRLGELGVNVVFHSTVGDTLAHNVDVFRSASQRADIVITTGGLGPTRDDLTREVLAELIQQPLELQQDALDHIHALFQKRKRAMPERNRVQAMFPKGSQSIHNPEGSAPGIDVKVARQAKRHSRIFALPGVPAEMKRMFDETVVTRILEENADKSHIKHSVMKFFGTGESDMEQRLGEMISRDRQPRVGITVSKATISLRITATANSPDECERLIQETRAEILNRVPELYFGDGEGFEQQHAIVETLLNRQESLAVIELGHAAPLADWFAGIHDAPCYRGGCSVTNQKQLRSLIGKEISKEAEETNQPFDTHGDTNNPAHMQQTLLPLMNETARRFNADWLLLVDAYPSLHTDHAGPLPAQEVSFWITRPDGSIIHEHQSMGGHPEVIHPRIAKAAMQFLRHQLRAT